MFYKKHMFICCNKKSDETGCGALGGDDAFAFAKKYLKSLDSWGEGKYRASKSACLGRCTDGPICVVYPEGIWYTYIDETDIQQIIDEYIINDKVVKHLQV